MAQVLFSRTEQDRRLGICRKCPERKEVANISIEGMTVDEIADIFERLVIGTGGIGRYYEGHGNFVHVDVREVRSRWIMGKRPAKDGKPTADKPAEPKAYLFGNEVECIIKDVIS